MAKWGPGKATPIVSHRGAARRIKKGAKVSSVLIGSSIPSEIAAALTDECGVTYYTDRMREAQEYRPFYSGELSSLQARLRNARTAAMGLVGSIQSSYDDTRDEIGVVQDEVLAMIGAVKTGSTGGDSDLRMAHDFIYGDGVYWEPLEDIINWIAGDVRSDLKRAINAVLATSREADKLLQSIDSLKNVVFGLVGQADEMLADVGTWNGNALRMAQNFCQETDDMGYLTDRVQLFHPREYNKGPGARTASYKNTGWSAWNDPCDTFRKEVDGSYSYQRWPRIGDSNYERPIARSLGYPDRAWGFGCRKDYFGEYDCGKTPGPGVRVFVDYLTSGLPDEVEALLNYDAEALFAESRTVMTAARQALDKVIRLLNGFKTVLNSTGMDAAIVGAAVFCGAGYSACQTTLNGYRNQGVRGLSSTVTSTLLARADLDMAIGQHTSAKAIWENPVTPWRVQANVYLSTLRSLNGPIQTPWTNSVSKAACRVVFPQIPNECLDKMIPERCSVSGGFVAYERVGWIDPSDPKTRGKGPVGAGGGIPTVLTELGALAPASAGPKRIMGLLPWQALVLIAGAWMLWPEKKR